VLLLKRNPNATSSGGAWVFPGGLIDRVDGVDNGVIDPIASARRAAVREAGEEAGLLLKPEALLPISRWTTPKGVFPKRFETWFFLVRESSQSVCVDRQEILAHQWLSPSEAILARRRGIMELPPPTFVNLTILSVFPDSSSALNAMAKGGVAIFKPRFRKIPGGFCSLYAEDAAYEGGALDLPGPRHRLWLQDSGWRYEKRL